MSRSKPPRQDQRRYARFPSFKSAQLVSDGPYGPVPVRILDMSSAGAKLEFYGPASPPETFKLVLHDDNPEERIAVNCHRLWQRKQKIGVRFC